MTKARRGSTLVIALMLTTILMVAGLGLLSRKAIQYSSLRAHEVSEQALLLAQSGLEDARLKLGKDLFFPPSSAEEQNSFTYSEELYSADGTTLVGSYRVDIDKRLAGAPSYVLLLTSRGTVGAEPETSRARRTVTAELDLNPTSSTYFQLLNYQDSGVR